MAAINYNFIPTPTATIQGEHKIPRHISPIFIYILGRMRIDGWKLHKADICKQCEISMPTLQRALKWLVANGYMAYDLINKWQVFPVPVTPQTKTTTKVNADQKVSTGAACNVPSPIIGDSPSPIIGDSPYKEVSFSQIEKQQPEPVRNLVTKQEPVVVFENEEKLSYPPQLTPKQKAGAKHAIKKLKTPEIATEVLFALSYAMAQNSVKNPVAYLNSLVTASNEGRFEPRNTATAATPGGSPLIPIFTGRAPVNVSKPEVASGFFAAMRSAVGRTAT